MPLIDPVAQMEDLIYKVVATLCIKAQQDGVDPFDVKGVYTNSKRRFKKLPHYLIKLEARLRDAYMELGPMA